MNKILKNTLIAATAFAVVYGTLTAMAYADRKKEYALGGMMVAEDICRANVPPSDYAEALKEALEDGFTVEEMQAKTEHIIILILRKFKNEPGSQERFCKGFTDLYGFKPVPKGKLRYPRFNDI